MDIFDKSVPVAVRIQLVISFALRFTIFIAFVSGLVEQRWTVAFVSLLILFTTFLPSLIERNLKIMLPIEFELIVTVFLYASLFLGEIHDYYTLFWWWDAVLHAGSGLALGFVGFLIMYTLYHEKKLKASPLLIAVFSFCFALALGALWEIFEFSMDTIFGFNMQKSGLVDTMWDLIVDAVGALIVSFFGWLYVKYKRKGIINHLVKKFIEENPRFFKD